MTKQEAYRQKAEAQLKRVSADIQKLRAKAMETEAEANLTYQELFDDLTAKLVTAQHEVERLQQAGSDTWEEFKNAVDAAFSDLEHSFNKVASELQRGGKDVLSWGTGMADEHKLESIGWAEGMAGEDKAESVGWAEGTAEEKEVASEGWPEGYEREKIHE